jgi:hypothetical protein
VLHELEHELSELYQRRAQIDVAIGGIKGILAAQRPNGHRVSVDSAPVRQRRGKSAVPTTGGAGRQVSLRTRIIEIINSTTRPNRAAVVQQLQQEGFQVSGATSLPIRVSHELSRLRRMGVLRKDRSGMLTVLANPRPAATAHQPGELAAVG